jgi:STE24 endopeptidase
MMAVSQLHIFTILALFPAFLHAPPLLRSFDFTKVVAAQPPTIVAFLLFQVCFEFFPTLFFSNSDCGYR